MSRRRDAATATMGAGLTATGGYLRHAGVQELIRHQGGDEPKVHGWAIGMRGNALSRKLYGGGLVAGAIGAPALAIGATKLVRRKPKEPVTKIAPKIVLHGTNSSAARNIKRNGFRNARGRMGGNGVYLGDRDEAEMHALAVAGQKGGKPRLVTSMQVGPKRRANGYGLAQADELIPVRNDGVNRAKAIDRYWNLGKRDKPSFLQEGIKGTGEALAERKDTLAQRDVPAKARAAGMATTLAAGAGGAYGARGLLRHHSPGRKALLTPIAGVLAGAAATPLSSRVVSHVSPGYEVTPSGVRRKKRALKRASSASFQHRDTPRSFQADIAKDASTRRYRAKVTAAGSVPVANYALQPLAAGHGIKDPSHRHRAEASQATATIGGDVTGALVGAHGAAYAAKHSDRFRQRAESVNTGIEGMRAKIGLKPKTIKPAAAANTRTGKIIRAATKPLHGKYAVAAGVGALAGTMTIGNAAQQAAISHNIKHNVGKYASPGMTKAEQQKQLKRKSRSAALSTVSGTLGLAGVGLLAAKHHPALAHRSAQLDSYALGTAIAGGGIGGYNSLKGARIQRRDIAAQRKTLGVAKGWKQTPEPGDYIRSEPTKRMLAVQQVHRHPKHKMVGHGRPMYRIHPDALYASGDVGKAMPDPSALHLPTGLLKVKTYAASSVRATPTGKLVRTKAGVR